MSEGIKLCNIKTILAPKRPRDGVPSPVAPGPSSELTGSARVAHLCRACAELCTPESSFCLAPPSPKHETLLRQYFNIQICPGDGMPTRLCYTCNRNLNFWEEVLNTVNSAQDFLHQLVLSPDCLPPQDSTEHNQTSDTQDSTDNTEIEDSMCIAEDTKFLTENIDLDSKLSPVKVEILPLVPKYTCLKCNFETERADLYFEHNEAHKLEEFKKSNKPAPKVTKQSTRQALNNIQSQEKRPPSPTNPFQCGLCPEKFKLPILLGRHMVRHMKNNKYLKSLPCAHCKVKCRKVEQLVKHQTQHVSNPTAKLSFACEECGNEFPDAKKLKDHSIMHQDVKNFKCPACPKRFKYKCQLIRNHFSQSHPDQHLNIDTLKCTPVESASKPLLVTNSTPNIQTLPPLAPKINPQIVTLMPSSQNSNGQLVFLLPTPPNNKVPIASTSNIGKTIPSTVVSPPVPKLGTPSVPKSTVSVPSKGTAYENNKPNPDAYPCGVCLHEFPDHVSFANHMELEKLKSPGHAVPCGFCFSVFKKISHLVEHTMQHQVAPDKVLSIQCDICSKSFHDIDTYKTHLRVHIQDKDYGCTVCGQVFKYKYTWKRHFETCHSEIKISEDYLKIIEVVDIDGNIKSRAIEAAKKINLKKLSKGVPKILTQFGDLVESFTCEICNINYDDKLDLFCHIQIRHLNEKELKCEFCFVQLGTADELKKHLQKNHVVKRVFCPVCGKGCKNRTTLALHVPLHSITRSFECEFCSKMFKTANAAAIHLKWHKSGCVEYKCDFCNKRFAKKTTLTYHIARHTNSLPYVCKVCSRGYPGKAGLIRHALIHTQPKKKRVYKKGYKLPNRQRNPVRKEEKKSEVGETLLVKLPRQYAGKKLKQETVEEGVVEITPIIDSFSKEFIDQSVVIEIVETYVDMP